MRIGTRRMSVKICVARRYWENVFVLEIILGECFCVGDNTGRVFLW